jgi:hypothetical protein
MECVRVHSLRHPGSNKRNVLRRAGTYLTPLTWFLQPKATTSLRPQPFLPRQAEAVYTPNETKVSSNWSMSIAPIRPAAKTVATKAQRHRAEYVRWQRCVLKLGPEISPAQIRRPGPRKGSKRK